MNRGEPVGEPKTKPSNASVSAFLAGVKDPLKRADCKAIAKMMREATGTRARMWGQSIIGYDQYDYTYASGRSGSWMMAGFSPRARDITVYIMPGFSKFGTHLKKLGKHKTTSRACISRSWRMSMKKCLLSLSSIPSGKCVASTAKNNAGTTL